MLSGIGYGAYSTFLHHEAILKLMVFALGMILAAAGIRHPGHGLCLAIVGVPLSMLSGYCVRRGEARLI